VNQSSEPIFNIPAVIVATLAVFVGIHVLRSFVLSSDQDLELLLLFAFIPARYDTALLLEGALPGGFGAQVWTFVSYAFLHADIAHLGMNSLWFVPFGSAVARHWGLGDEVLHMIRRLPVDAPVRRPDGDADLLRIVASAANEAVDVVSHLPAAKVAAALGHVAQRYARVLRCTTRSLVDAVHEARTVLRKGGQVGAAARPDDSAAADSGAGTGRGQAAEARSATGAASASSTTTAAAPG